jgi:flagellar M-ring protein FliF
VEKNLMEQGESMLKRILGRGNAVVRVSAELNFDRTVTTKNTIDPESATVISEERSRENNETSEEGSSNSTSTVRNYEVSRTEKRSEESAGDVSRLTVSVMVNYEQTGEEGADPTYEPRSEEEMDKIASIVKSAVGFDASRGDEFTIQQTRFDGTPTTQAGQVIRDDGGETGTRTYLRYGLLLLVIGVAVWMARSLGRRLTQRPIEESPQLQPNQPAQLDESEAGSQLDEGASDKALAGETEDEEAEELVLEDDMYTSKLSDEAKARIEARSEMFEEIQDQVEEHPEQTAELIRAWLVEDRSV